MAVVNGSYAGDLPATFEGRPQVPASTFLGIGGQAAAAPVVVDAAPVLAVVTPYTHRTSTVTLDVTATTSALRVIAVSANYAGRLPDELVFADGSFSPTYAGVANQLVAITDGFRLTFLRDGGYPATPTFTVYAVTALGTMTVLTF